MQISDLIRRISVMPLLRNCHLTLKVETHWLRTTSRGRGKGYGGKKIISERRMTLKEEGSICQEEVVQLKIIWRKRS